MWRLIVLSIFFFFSILTTNAETDCGLIKVEDPTFLAFNATSSYPGQWPWLASLFHSKINQINKGFVCGSSIITKWHLLTAAHCVISAASDYHALLGRYDLSDSNEFHWLRRNMSAVYVHPDFNANAPTIKSDGDIAIFRVSKRITFSNHILPICLPQPSTNAIGVKGLVAGYGLTETYGNYQNTPNHVALNSISSWECLGKNIKYGLIISERGFCAGSESSITCQGDSGSGYYVMNPSTRQHTIYGIVSTAIGQCDPRNYVAFVDVSKFITWINEKINDRNFAVNSNNYSCEESECGENSKCTIVNGIAKCSCEDGILGSPPYCGSRCNTDLDCSDDRKCLQNICIDLCLQRSTCAANTLCIMKNHQPECKCKNGFEGNGNYYCTKVNSENHLYGEPETILKFSDDNKIVILDESINKTFDHPDVKDRKIVAFSINGPFRKGKSFFLDYCLRYLYAHYKSINYPDNPLSSPDNWIGAKNEPLKGFWGSGSRFRDRFGIIMWNDVFLHDNERTGQKIGIVVMYTQGLFDTQTTPLDNSRIFALGTLISSIQILNLMDVVQEDQLQYLQFATEFAKYASDDSHGTSEKPFQNLMFLIRDWANEDEHSFGIEGGEDYMNLFLKIEDNQKEELKTIRQLIRSSFDKLSCSLLPYPGRIVSSNKKRNNKMYNGNWGDMDEEFKDELEILINHLLSPDHLIVKKINGNELNGSEFQKYLIHFFKLFQTDVLPQPKSIYESSVKKRLLN